MNIKILLNDFDIIEGDFSDISKFNFNGVYIIYDQGNEVVYVGSAYSRFISTRLSQYLNSKDTGNTLMHAICKNNYNILKVKDIEEDYKNEAIKEIKKLKIKAIKHEDLEYKLIRKAQPKYNTAGIDIDYSE